MKNIWRWIIGIIVGLVIVALLLAGSSSRRAYRVAHGAIETRVGITQDKIDAAAELATASVDLALKLAGDLPSQEAKADLVKQDINEISSRLKEAADAKGQAAVDKLDQSIENFNTALQAVDDAAKAANDPQVKATLDRIYGVLLATQEQITEFLITGPK
jgi:gas vesicle protein